MSNGRRQIQTGHEDAIIAEFINWTELNGHPRYELVARPDPPDVLLRSSSRYMWVELTDVYRSGEEAHEERALVTPSEQHFHHSEHPILSPDARTAEALVRVIKVKISMDSYLAAFEQYGPGVLICCERDPLFDGDTLQRIVETLHDTVNELDAVDRGFFKEVYLYERSGNGRPATFHRLLAFTSKERIRHLAYELYEKRGRQHGHDLDDWLKAENEIKGGA